MGERLVPRTQAKVESVVERICRPEQWITPLLATLKQKDPALFRHSMNSAYIAGKLAIHEGFPHLDVLKVVKATAAHDCGKPLVPGGIPKKLRNLPLREKERIVNGHVGKGFEAIQPHNNSIAEIVLHHHDKPLPVASEGDTEAYKMFVKMLTLVVLADKTDGVLSVDRGYRDGEPCSEEEIAEEMVCFDPKLVTFARSVWESVNPGVKRPPRESASALVVPLREQLIFQAGR